MRHLEPAIEHLAGLVLIGVVVASRAAAWLSHDLYDDRFSVHPRGRGDDGSGQPEHRAEIPHLPDWFRRRSTHPVCPGFRLAATPCHIESVYQRSRYRVLRLPRSLVSHFLILWVSLSIMFSPAIYWLSDRGPIIAAVSGAQGKRSG